MSQIIDHNSVNGSMTVDGIPTPNSDLFNDSDLNVQMNGESIAELPSQMAQKISSSSAAPKRSFDAVEHNAQPAVFTRRRSSNATTKHSRRSSLASKPLRKDSASTGRIGSREESMKAESESNSSNTHNLSEEEEEGETGPPDSKERSREKNKVAAAKCRAKKRENMELIESSHRSLSAENTYLKKHEQQLRATVAELRTLALDHQHCNCGVHQYNIIQAGNLARGLGDLHMQHFGNAAPCGMHPGGGSGAQNGVKMSNIQQSPSQDTSSPMSNDFSRMNSMDSMNPMGQIDMNVDIGPDNLFDLQTPMDNFFGEFNGSTEYPLQGEFSQGL